MSELRQKLKGRLLPSYFYTGIPSFHLSRVFLVGVSRGVVVYIDSEGKFAMNEEEHFSLEEESE